MEDHQAGEALEEVEEEALLEEVEEEAVGVEDFKYSTSRKHQSNLMKTIHIEIYLHQLGMKLSVYLYSKKSYVYAITIGGFFSLNWPLYLHEYMKKIDSYYQNCEDMPWINVRM